MPSPSDPTIPRDLTDRTTQVERTGPASDQSLHGLAVVMDAARWRRIAALMREIDEAKRGGPNVRKAENSQGMDDDDLLDLALKALRDFPVLVQRRHDYRLVVDRLRQHGWTGDPIATFDHMCQINIDRNVLLTVFDAINTVAGPNIWLKRMRLAVEDLQSGRGNESLRYLAIRAYDARGTVDDLNGVWDTTGADEGGATGETGDCEG